MRERAAKQERIPDRDARIYMEKIRSNKHKAFAPERKCPRTIRRSQSAGNAFKQGVNARHSVATSRMVATIAPRCNRNSQYPRIITSE